MRILNLFLALTISLAIVSGLFLISMAFGDSDIQLEQVYVGYKSFFPGGTSYLITNNGLPDREIGKEISLHVDAKFLEVFYWHTLVHGTSDLYSETGKGGQFRAVGLQMELGLRFTSFLDLEYHHHSQHVLDQVGPFHFPVEDSIGFNLYLYRAKSKPDSLF